MNWGSLLFYPVPSREHGYRLLAIGGPFFVLTVLGLVYRRVQGRNVNALRIGAAFTSPTFTRIQPPHALLRNPKSP